MLIKYLFKYISKGADRVHFSVGKKNQHPNDSPESSSPTYDEVKSFVDVRFICPHEAAWRIFEFPIHNRNPSVQVLAVHLENMQNVTFKDSEHLQAVVNNPDSKRTTLTEWLHSNRLDINREGRHLRYVEYVSKYKWDASKKRWILRSLDRTPAIGTLIYIHPSSGETFFLRMLLNHQNGCQSFSDIRIVGGVVFPTYHSACEKLGLLANDNEWTCAFTEASAWATSKELRCLFAHMLLFCDVSDPLTLWQKHLRSMSDDVCITIERNIGFRPSHLNDNDLQQHVLFELELLLNASGTPCSLSQFGLPMPRSEFASILKNRLLMEEKIYDTQMLADQHQVLKSALHTQQLFIYESAVN